jgi:hypothetical protein
VLTLLVIPAIWSLVKERELRRKRQREARPELAAPFPGPAQSLADGPRRPMVT